MGSVNIIVAFCTKNFGIGYNNGIPWHIKEDLVHFSKITQNAVVIMGRKTWESIPEDKRPLKNRINVVLTSNPSQYNCNNCIFTDTLDISKLKQEYNNTKDIFIIGGERLYKEYVGYVDNIYATLVYKDVLCDTFFPIEKFEKYTLNEYSPLMFSENEQCNFRHVRYCLTDKTYQHGEYEYLNNMKKIIEYGNKRDDRTGTGTLSLFGPQIRFDISRHLPLITTKFVSWKLTIKELLWFLRGQTNSKLLETQGVNIWKGNTTRDFLDKRGLTEYDIGDIGSMYGWIWRHIGAEYNGCNKDYTGQGHDQLLELIDGLKKDPFSRRHMITTYCPLYNDKGVLLPCHGIVVQFYVEVMDDSQKHLSCQMYQRSCDTFLGSCYNIASYSILTHIIAKMCDMKPKELVITSGDCHVYMNHIEQAHLQLSRKPLPFPVVEVSESIKNKTFDEITLDDFDVIGYLHHPSIRAPMAV